MGKGCHANDEREGLQLMDLGASALMCHSEGASKSTWHFDKFQNKSQQKFQRGHVFRNRLHRLRDKVDGQSRLEHGGYQRKCH